MLWALTLALAMTGAAAQGKKYPVSRVVQLLKDMHTQLKEEQEADEEVYEKIACWCTTNEKQKTKAVADAQARISDLTSTIEALTAESAQLTADIEGLEKEIAKNQEALDVATALREKQLAEFNEEEKEMLQCIKSLEAAIIVLSKHHKASLASRRMALGAVVERMHQHEDLLRGKVTPRQRRALTALAQEPDEISELQGPNFNKAYKAQSGEIFGILKQMKESFEENLSESQKEEIQNREAYKELKEAKEEEIAAGQEMLESKRGKLAAADEKKAQATEDLEDTEAALDADQKFLLALQEKCSMTDKEWEERQKTRMEEMKAVSEAIAILSSDESRDLFSKTFNPALLQESSAGRADDARRRSGAASVVGAAARKAGSQAMALLATVIRIDSFTKVKEAIDKMVAQLLTEKKDEIKHKDFCIGELNENEIVTARKVHKKENAESTLAGLDGKAEALAKEIKALEEEIAELEVAKRGAAMDREAEHKAFQEVVADQRETQAVLKKAEAVLKKVYRPESLAQVGGRQAPPEGFSEYKKQGADGVLSLLQQIIHEARMMEEEAVHNDNAAQKDYEDFVKKANASIEADQASIVDKQEDKAKAEKAIEQAKADLDAVNSELEGLSEQAGALHKSCDYVLKNFEVRQAARDEEVEALKTAKAILSGMAPPE